MTLTLEKLAEKTLTRELKTFKDLHQVIDKQFRYKNGKKNVKGLSSALKRDLKEVGEDSPFELKKEALVNSYSKYLEEVSPTPKSVGKQSKTKELTKDVASEQASLELSVVDEKDEEVKSKVTAEENKQKIEVPQASESIPEPKEEDMKVVDQVTDDKTTSAIYRLAKETLEAGWFQEVSQKDEQDFLNLMKSKAIILRKNKEMSDIYTLVNRARKKKANNQEAQLELLVGYFDKTVRVSKK